MADDQTIRELQTTDDYMAQLISFLTNRVEAIENDPTTINSAIESLSARMDNLETSLNLVMSNISIWVTIFGVILAVFGIIIAIIGIGIPIYVNKKDEEIKILQKEGIENAKKEILREIQGAQKSLDSKSESSDDDNNVDLNKL